MRILEALLNRILSTLRGAETAPIHDEIGPAEKIINAWPDAEEFRVSKALELHPELALDPKAIIDFAIEEYFSRRDAGESLTPTMFAESFPTVRTRLLDNLAIELDIAEGSGLFEPIFRNDANDIEWPKLKTEVANLRLKEELGRGGFSVVYVAEDLECQNREIAVKLCRADTHEVQMLAPLQHNGIGTVFFTRAIPEQNLVAICMPLISRTSLHAVARDVWARCRTKRIHTTPSNCEGVWDVLCGSRNIDQKRPHWTRQRFVDWAVRSFVQVASALAEAHSKGIIHCDIKPSNLLVTRDGNLVLIDFNVAFAKNAVGSPANVGGTVPYMAPEQIRAFAGIDFSDISPCTDLFSLGATLYHLLTGHLPFPEVTSFKYGTQALLNSREIQPPSVRQFNPQVSPELDRLVMRMLSREVSKRPQSAHEVAEELQRIADAPRVRMPRHHDRRTSWFMVAATGGLTAAVALGVQLSTEREANHAAPVVAAPMRIAAASTEDLMTDAYELLDSGNANAAISAFQDVILSDANHTGARIGLARARACLGEFHNAMQTISGIDWTEQRIEPTEISAFRGYLMGRTASIAAEYENAVMVHELVMKRGTTTPTVLGNQAAMLLRVSRPNDAVNLLDRARLADPENSNLKVLTMIAMTNARAQVGQQLQADDFAKFEQILAGSVSGAKQCWYVADLLSMLGKSMAQTDPNRRIRLSEWSREHFLAGMEAPDAAAFRSNWNVLKPRLTSQDQDLIGDRFRDVPADAQRVYVDYCEFMSDPLADTQRTRLIDRDWNAESREIATLAR